MQRWIAMAVAGVILIICGGGYAWWNYKQNRPHPIWVPLPINSQVSDEKRHAIAKELKAKLGTPENLERISKDLNLPKRWRMANDQQAAQEIGRRLFVKVGEADSPEGRVPALNIGVEGTRKDKVVSGEITMRLMDDVRNILGLKPPPPKEF